MDIIVTAIRERRCLRFSYRGLSRVVEPHAYGVSRKGDDVLRCYQLEGGSESSEPEGWKLMRTSDMTSISLAGEFPGPRPQFSRGDKHMMTIYEEL
jgi:hypothetical protein